MADIVKKSERAAGEISRLKNGREDWPDRFKTFVAKLAEVAKAQNVVLDNLMLEKIRPKIAELAKRKGEIADIVGELEELIVDSI